MHNFPIYSKLANGSTRWRLSDLLQFEAERDNTEPAKLTPEAERFLSAQQVARRYGVSVTTVWRWSRDSRQGVAA